MERIRPFMQREERRIRFICMKTAPGYRKESDSALDSLLLLYENYYMVKSSAYCYIATNRWDVAIGYVLCAPSFKEYVKRFTKEELIRLYRLGEEFAFTAVREILTMLPYSKRYPAHVHTHVLQGYRRQGRGGRLIEALVEHLKRENIPGVMLIVSPFDLKSINFYKKCGFKRIGINVMGMRLDKDR